jgi:hypothetical protein
LPDLQYGLSNYDRDRGNFPKIPLVNMFAEQVPVEPNPALQSRPGLEETGTVLGNGPVRGLFQIDGVLSGQMFAVSDGQVYSSSTSLGSITGTGPVAIAGFENRVFFTAGLTAVQYDGTTLTDVTTPDGFDVLSLCVGTSRLIVIDSGTGHFYWSNVLDPTVGALSFATAENSPDKLKECLFLGDTLMLFGTETVEFWPASSSNPDLPYTPLVGRTFQVGIRDTGCASLFKGTFAWITNHNQICVGDANNVISNPSLEEKITDSVTAKLWSFHLEGTEFLAVTLDDSTWVFASTASQWSVFESYGEGNWIPRCYANGVFGSGVDGRLIQWSNDHADFGEILERRFRAGMPLTAESTPLSSVLLRTNPGHTSYLTGDYSNPTVELRTSKDGGYTWSDWKQRSLGAVGKYRTSVMWRSLGFFSFPAMMVEIRVTDPVPFRVSGVVANEGYGRV